MESMSETSFDFAQVRRIPRPAFPSPTIPSAAATSTHKDTTEKGICNTLISDHEP